MADYIKSVYARMNKWIFWISMGVSIFLILVAFFIPPKAQIDGSVIAAVGELFAFPALATVLHAIERGSDVRLQKGDVTVHIDNPDGGEKPEPRHGRE